MAKSGGEIRFGIGFDVNKSGLNDLKKSLQDIQKMTTKDLVGDLGGKSARETLEEVKRSASQVEQALKKAFNPTLNTTNVTKFNQELKKTGTDLNTVYQDFSKLGMAGQTAFTNLAANILTTNVRLKQTHSLLNTMGTTMMNTVKWGIASSVMNSFTGSIQNAYNYVKVLDSSLTDIRIVTGQSREEMDRFAESANKAAQSLGRQTKDYTNAALTFYQQGLNDDQVAARTETTLKASNITGAAVDDMANQLTAVWNGFQVSIEDTQDVVSKLAAVADTSASNMSELAKAMSKTASVANNMGVDVDQLSAQIATIIATTRQAPETVGNALKTIYSRINDIKAGSDEAEISLGNYTGKMAALGIQVLDQQGNLRETGQVMEQIGDRWSTMTHEQQVYLAQTMAGQRQMNILMSLFQNWDMYTKELNVSLQSQGTLDQKNAIAMESLAAHTRSFQAATEGLIQSLTNADSFKGFIDLGTGAVNILTRLVDAIGGGGTAILGLGSIFTSVFSGIIGRQLNNFIINLQNAKYNQEQLNQVIQNTKTMASIEGIKGTAVDAMVERQQEIQKYYSVMSEAEINHQNDLIKELGLAEQEKAVWEDNTDKAKKFASAITGLSKENVKLFDASAENADNLTKIGGSLEEVKSRIEQTTTDFEKFKNALTENQNLDDSQLNLVDSFVQLKKAIGLSTDEANALGEKLLNLDLTNPGQRAKFIAEIKKGLEDAGISAENLDKILKDNGITLDDLANRKIPNLNKSLDQSKDAAKQAFDTKNIVSMIGAVGQLATAWQTLANLPSIWHDDDIPKGEKFLRTVMSLSMVLPMMYSSATKISTGLSSLFSAISSVTTATEAQTAAEGAAAAAKEGNAAATATQVMAEQAADVAKKDVNTTNAGQVVSQGAVTGAKIANAGASAAQAGAQAGSNIVKKIATAVNTALASSELLLKMATLGVAAAIGIAIVAYNSYITKLKKARQAQIQASKTRLEQIRTKQDQIKAQKDLGQTYLDAYQQYKLGNITKQEMERVTQSLISTYNNELIAVANLTGNYDQLTESIKRARREKIEQLKDQQKQKIKQADNMADVAFAQAGGKIKEGTKEGTITLAASSGTNKNGAKILDLLNKTVTEGNLDTEFEYSDTLTGETSYAKTFTIDIKTLDGKSLSQLYSELQGVLSIIEKDSELYANPIAEKLIQIKDSIQDTALAYQEAAGELENYNGQLKALDLNFDQIDNLKDFSEKRDQLIKWFQDNTEKDQQQIDTLVNTYISEFGGQAAAAMEGQIQAINSIVKQFNLSAQEEIRSKLLEYTPEQIKILASVQFQPGDQNKIDEILQQARVEAEKNAAIELASFSNTVSGLLIDNATAGLTEQEVETIQEMLETVQDIEGYDEERLKIFTDQNASLRDQIKELQTIRGFQKESLQNDIDNAEKNYIESLDKQIQEMAKARNKAYNDYLVAQAAYEASPTDENALAYRNDQLAAYNTAKQGVEDLQAKRADEKGIQEEVNKIVDSLQLEKVTLELQGAKDMTLALAQGASLIDQNWKVAAEDVSTLQSIFPNLLKGQKALADGSYQLNETLVRKAMADYEKTIQDSLGLQYDATQKSIKINQDGVLHRLQARKEELDKVTNLTEEQKSQYNQIISMISTMQSAASEAFNKAESAAIGEGGNIKEKTKEEEAADDFDFEGLMAQIQKQMGDLSEQDYEKWVSGLDDLIEKYPQLRNELQLLKNTALAGSEAYEDALKKLQDLLDQEKLEEVTQAADRARVAFRNAFRTDDIDNFFDKLNDYTSAEYAVDIEVHTQAERAFEEIEETFKDIQDAASSIGQDWVIPADKIREINAIFPGILQGMELAADGSYQLNQEIAQNAINAATAEASAQANSVRARLQQQSTLLHAKAASYRRMAQAASQLAAAETDSSVNSAQAQETISAQLSNIKQINSQLTATKEASDQQAVANSSQANGRVTAMNWAEAANSSAQSIYAFAKNACDNMKAVAEGGQPTPPGPITMNYGGTAGESVQLSSIEETEKALSNPDTSAEAWESMRDQFNAMAEASEEAANDIDGMLGEIGANANQIANGLQNLNEGRAWKDNGSKSKKGGGGGGGGKSKTKSADQIEKDKLKDQDIDRYHQLDRAIKDVEETLNDLNKAEGKTIRNGLSKTIDQQVAGLEMQKALYEQKLALMQNDLQLKQADLQALGVQFDEQGNIINYTALMIAYQQAYNALLEEAKLLTGTAQENKLKQAEELKTKLENLKSQMNAYESLQDQIVAAGNSIQDILDKEEELRIQQFKIKIDWQLDKAQVEKDWNEFRKNVIDGIGEDDFLGQAKARLQDFFTYYKEDGGGIIQELTEHVNKTRREAEIIENGGTSSIYGQNQAQALEDLKHYTDELMQNLEEVEQITKDIQELYLNTIDKANDAFDEQIEKYEQIEDIIDHDLNLIQMLKPETNEEELARYYELRRNNNNQQIDFYRKETDMWKRQMDAAEEGTEEWKKFRDNWMESVSDMNDAVENAVENLLDKYNNTISKIIRQTKDQILGGDWKRALDEWDRAKWFDDRYLDTASRGNGMLDFIANVNKAMEGASTKQQQDLLKFMNAEVDRLNEMTKVRQIDLDIANKKLEVLQKQYALEEAQESKTQMRLRRDSQGNYTYQYVADQNTIETKQQELRDVLEELRLLAKEDLTDTIDTVEEKLEEFFDKAQELSEIYYDDSEVLQEKLLELQEEYWGEEGYITMLGIDYNLMQGQLLEATAAQFSELYRQQGEELAAFLGLGGESQNGKSVWGSIKALIGADGGAIPTLLEMFTTQVIPDNFNQISAENQNLLFGPTGLQPSWNTALGDMSYAVGEFALNYGNAGRFIYDVTGQIIIPAIAAMIEATRTYGQDLITLQQVAGISFSNIVQGIDVTIGYTEALIQDNGMLIDSFENEITAVARLKAELGGLCAQFQNVHNDAIAAAEAALTFYAAAQGVAATYSLPSYLTGHADVSVPDVAPTPSPSGGGSTETKKGGGPSGTQQPAKKTTADQGNRQYWTQMDRIKYGQYSTYNEDKSPMSSREQVARIYHMGVKYATGGYTGAWANGDNEGRLAFLHQKELVLNADDTANMLATVNIVRGIMSDVSGMNFKMQNGLPSSGAYSAFSRNTDNSTSQNIVINADFPNVSDALEIKQAFNNLVNIASQKANGNRRTY